MTLRLATRSSPLALEQAGLVAERLRGAGYDVEIVPVLSEGDRRAEAPITALGATGAFTGAVERAVLDGRADVAVHSAKDLPTAPESGELVLGSVPERADVRDVLVGGTLEGLAPGTTVLTGAPRRRAQLAYSRPDLSFGEVRGNIGTRLARRRGGSALVVALAALERLGLDLDGAEVLPTSVMLPQVGQGALALRCRAGDGVALEALGAIDDPGLHRALLAERAFLATLGSGCLAPVAAYAQAAADGELEIEALIASPDGHLVLRRRQRGADPGALGEEVALRLLEDDGASSLLDSAAAKGTSR